MLNPDYRIKLNNLALSIGNQLNQSVIRSPAGWHWETQTVGKRRPDGSYEILWHVAHDLYAGNAGILVYFNELHNRFPEDNFEPTIRGSAQWLWHCYQTRTQQDYGFITGWLGVAWALQKASQTLAEPVYQQRALQIARESQAFIKASETVAEYFSGLAGIAIGLINLHQATHESFLLSLLEEVTRRLLSQAHWGEQGVYYGQSPLQTRGLCGFSHGAAGVAAAFLEIGNYVSNPAFYRVAFQLFQYEDSLFDQAAGQWPDFRCVLDPTDEAVRLAMQQNDWQLLTKPYLMSAWCHGNVGIGLVRLRAYQLTNDPDLLPNLERSIDAHLERAGELDKTLTNFTLCHGIAGNLLLLTDARAPMGNQRQARLAIYADQIVARMLAHHDQALPYLGGYANSITEDFSLFMGNAGIGYAALYLAEPTVQSVLYPIVSKPTDQLPAECITLRMSWTDLQSNLLTLRYGRTLSVLRKNPRWWLLDTQPWDDEQAILHKSVDMARQQTEHEDQGLLEEAWALDRQFVTADSAFNPAVGLVREWYRQQLLSGALMLDQPAFGQLWLQCCDGLSLVSVTHNWQQAADYTLPSVSTDLRSRVIWYSAQGVEEDWLPYLQELMLSLFLQPRKAIDAVNEVKQQFDVPDEQRKPIEDKLYYLLKGFLQKGLLRSIN